MHLGGRTAISSRGSTVCLSLGHRLHNFPETKSFRENLARNEKKRTIEIAGWCRNVTDEVYKTYAFDASSFSNVVINFVGEPRTYGLDFTVRF